MKRLILTILFSLLASHAIAAGIRVGDAPDAGVLTGSERIPIDRGNSQALSTSINRIRTADNVVNAGTCSTSYNINVANGSQVTLTLNGACQIGVSSLLAGQGFILYLTQTATTEPTFTSVFKWAGGSTPTFSTSATKYDTVSCASPDGVKLICGAVIDAR
jgi:hypothetical protein